MVLPIQIFGIIVIVFSLVMVLIRFFRRHINFREFTLWGIFWILLIILIIFPDLMTRLAHLFGVTRGVDILSYPALILLFYLIFKINIRLEKIEQDITKIVKEEALKKK